MPSHFRTFPWETIWETPWEIIQLPRGGETFELEAADLPLLREQLELRLKQLDLAERSTAAVRRQLTAHLEDVEKVERQLADRDG